jgi:hypothetical protein
MTSLRFSLFLTALALVVCALFFALDLPFRGEVAGVAALSLPVLFAAYSNERRYIDSRLASHLGNLRDYSVYTRTLPFFRYVDIYNAARHLTGEAPDWIHLDTEHFQSLENIVNREFPIVSQRRMKLPTRISRPVSEDEETFVPSDSFWVRPDAEKLSGAAIRVRMNPYTSETELELAAREEAEASDLMKRVLDTASERSIYKNKTLTVSFTPEVKDGYGEIERRDAVDPIFVSKPPVTEKEIILDEKTQKILERTLVDFHRRRKELMEAGLPGRRGVLFYGPPGTGKTFTCRYVSHKMGEVTTIISSGLSLLHIKSICNIARMLQPSLVVLEDVDLVYSNREQNPYTTALGDLMDELDGFSPEDHILFVLTTNAIDRVEKAIQERPGRISQCIYFGAPTAPLRRRYLEAMLEPYDTSRVDWDGLISGTEGTTQAFLKEFVYRTVQIATETQKAPAGELVLEDRHFAEALEEMRTSADRSGEAIIGFRVRR